MGGTENIKLMLDKSFPVAIPSIAGDNYAKYEEVLYPVMRDISDYNQYIDAVYPFIFTGSNNLSWQQRTNIINKHIELEYKPSTPNIFYQYNEIYNLFLIGIKPTAILNIGVEHGFIEYLAHKKIINLRTPVYFIGNDKSTPKMQKFANGALDIANSTIQNKLDGTLYNLVGMGIKSDMVIFNYYPYLVGIDYNFAFKQIPINFVAMLVAIESLVIGGTLILHMYSVINKSSADVFVILNECFTHADLYYPECSNEYSATGTWAIFRGFKGIDKSSLDKLYYILDQIKYLYPRGLLDLNIYDPHIRQKCVVYKQTSPELSHEYIHGYLPDYTPDNRIYDKIREFNIKTYARKYKFTNLIYKLAKEKPYPYTYLLPTLEQQQASVNYLKKWGFKFKLTNKLGSEPKLASIFHHNIPEKDKHTYLVKTHYLEAKEIDKEFNKRGNWEKYNPQKHKRLDFFYMDGVHISDRRLFHIKSVLKNLTGDLKKEVTVKNNLYKNLSRIPGTRDFLPWTMPFDIKNKPLSYLNTFKKYFASGRPLICKIGDEGRGQNIINTDKFEDFLVFMKAQHAEMIASHGTKKTKWVLQEYMDNPLLINGRKFHIRMMMIYQTGDHPSYYMHHTRIAVAKEPYVKGDWMNKAIHDTHFHKTPGLNWPRDFSLTNEQIRNIYSQYDYICSCIISSINPECYKDSKYCFETFGLDLLITNDYQVKLIEVNEKIDISAADDLKQKYFNGILNLVVDEYFPPLNKQVIQGNFYKIHKLAKPHVISNGRIRRTQKKTGIKHWITFKKSKSNGQNNA